ncbi:Suppressor of tumorigenicity 14 protein-like, partial [Armadillidium vulgare]
VQCYNYSVTNCSCGLEYSIRERILGGRHAKESEYPWQVALFNRKHYFCGGSIINNLYILSAAHCFKTVIRKKLMTVDKDNLSIVLGGHQLKKVDLSKENKGNVDIRHALYVFLHQFFDPLTYANDVSLIRLKEPIEEYSFKMLPVCLPPIGESFEDFDAIVSGWGAEREGGSSVNVLRETDVRVLSHSTCSKKLKKHYKKDIMICAASPGHDACQGDSGGPLVDKMESK